MKQTRIISMMLILVGATSYGLLSSLLKLSYDAGFNDIQVSVSQVTMGTLMMLLLVAVTPKARQNPFRGPWIRLSLIGIFGLAGTTVLYNAAIGRLPASLSIVLLFQFTWITIVMECIARRTLPTRYQTLSILVVLMGTLLAVNVWETDWGELSLAGVLYGLAAATSYSLFLFTGDKVQTELHPLMKSAVMLTAGLAAVYVIYPPTVLSGAGVDTGTLLLWGLALGFMGQVIPTLCFLVGIPMVGASLAALLGSMELPAAIIGAFLILGEQVDWPQWVGMFLILGGILISERKAGGDRTKDGTPNTEVGR